MQQTILILGGDTRQAHLSSLLRSCGHRVFRPDASIDPADLSAVIHQARFLLLPHPVSRDNLYVTGSTVPLAAVLSALAAGQHVIGGGFSAEVLSIFHRAGVTWTDCAKDAAYLTYNAALTAQGALRLLLDNTEDTLAAGPYLVTGFGRVGSAVAALLCAIGCDVTVAARSPQQRAKAAALGCKTKEIDDLDLSPYHVIINTVPHRIFSKDAASRICPDAQYLELASPPFGADRSALTCTFLDGAALPGRYTPKAAARAWLPLINAALNGGEDVSTLPSAMPSPALSAVFRAQ